MSWAPGTIVVCVDDRKPSDLRLMALSPVWVVRNQYYTIRDCFLDEDGWCVRLNEIVCYLNPFRGLEQCWSKERFRLAESSHSEAGSVKQKVPADAAS